MSDDNQHWPPPDQPGPGSAGPGGATPPSPQYQQPQYQQPQYQQPQYQQPQYQQPQYQQPQYQQPQYQQPPPGQAGPYGAYPAPTAMDITPALPAPRRKRRVGIVVGLVAGGLLLATAAGAAVVVGMALNGGGDQPEQHVPGTAVAFAKVDLDPSAGQKIDLIRFVNRLPKVTDGTSLREDSDLRKVAYEDLTKKLDGALPWSKVEPWLGSRAGVAVLSSSTAGTPDTVIALQVSDESAARTALAHGIDGSSGAVVSDGWALLAPTQAAADAAAAAAKSAPLATSAGFAADAKALGEDGVAAAWVDLPAVQRVAGSAAAGSLGMGGLNTKVQGRVIAALRLDGATLELAGKWSGAPKSVTSTQPSGLAGLPAGATIAVGAAVDPVAVERQWKDNQGALAGALGTTPQDVDGQIESAFGLKMPDDLVTLLGNGIAVAVEDVGSDAPVVGVRGRSVPGRHAAGVVQKVVDYARQHGTDLQQRSVTGGWVVSTDSQYADTMTKGGTLGSNQKVKNVVPDVGTAPYAAYVDLEALASLSEQSGDRDGAATLRALKAVGFSASTSDTVTSFTLRLGG